MHWDAEKSVHVGPPAPFSLTRLSAAPIWRFCNSKLEKAGALGKQEQQEENGATSAHVSFGPFSLARSPEKIFAFQFLPWHPISHFPFSVPHCHFPAFSISITRQQKLSLPAVLHATSKMHLPWQSKSFSTPQGERSPRPAQDFSSPPAPPPCSFSLLFHLVFPGSLNSPFGSRLLHSGFCVVF